MMIEVFRKRMVEHSEQTSNTSKSVECTTVFSELYETIKLVTEQDTVNFKQNVDPTFYQNYDLLSEEDKKVVVAVHRLGEQWIQSVLRSKQDSVILELRHKISIHDAIILGHTPSRIQR